MITAACHIHSDWSYDGKWPLQKLAAQFARRGYGAMMVTEHDRGFTRERFVALRAACAEASSPAIFVLPGIEYSDAENLVHILVWGTAHFLGEGLPTLELLQAVRAAGGLAVLAHPSRRAAWKKFDSAWAEYLLGIEFWNRKTDGWAPSKAAPAILAAGKLIPFTGLDFHDRNQFFPLSIELDLSGPANEQSMIDCLAARRCRALAFGHPAEGFAGGWTGSGLSVAEFGRRGAARALRLIRRRNGSGAELRRTSLGNGTHPSVSPPVVDNPGDLLRKS